MLKGILYKVLVEKGGESGMDALLRCVEMVQIKVNKVVFYARL